MPTVDVSVAAGADDGHWSSLGFFGTGMSANFGDTGGFEVSAFFRFDNVGVPAGATIDTAHITFVTAAGASATTINVNVTADDADDPAAPTSVGDANGRTRTTASVAWSPGTWTTTPGSNTNDTPEIKTVIQELVDRAGWASGQAMLFFLDGAGSSTNAQRFAASEENTTYAPAELHIEYSYPSQDISLNHIASGTTVYSMTTVPPDQNLSFNLIAAGSQVFQPTVERASLEISLNHLGATSQVFQPTIFPEQFTTLNHISGASSVYQLLVAPDQDIALNHLGPTGALYQMLVAPDQDVSLNHLGPTSQVYAMERIRLILILSPARSRGVRPPEFVLVFTGPLPDDRTLVRMGLPPEVELQFGSDLPGGWSRASAGVLEPGIAQRLSAIDYQRMMLPEELDVPRFAHATIYDEGGTGHVWEGRRSSAGGIGPETRRVAMLGYGVTGLRDDVMPSGNGSARTAQVVRRAIAQSSKISVLEVDDPDVMRDWSEFGGQHLSNVLEALTETGNGAARMTYTVYHRQLSFVALTPPDRPDYVIPWDETVEWDDDDEAIYTRIELTYTGLDGVVRQVTERSREAEDRYGVVRTLPLSGGTMTAGAARAYARTELAQRSTGKRAVSVTRMWSRDLETLYGGKPIWMVRAGEWVQVGSDGPLQPIESVSYSQVPGQGRVQLGLPISDDARSQWRRLLRLETATRTGRNVVTRTRVA